VSDGKKLSTRQARNALVFGSDDEKEAVKQELASLAASDITEVMEWSVDGRISLRSSDDVSASARKAIKKIKVTPTRMGNAIEVEMHDKVSALRMLAKHHGLLEPGLEKSDRPSVLGINLHGPVVTNYEEKDGADETSE
jgi:hypothetical protein|tara:strand:+ start:112 stop:528 length:417 start_codon:yes stop_codon:yes gene_type:complete